MGGDVADTEADGTSVSDAVADGGATRLVCDGEAGRVGEAAVGDGAAGDVDDKQLRLPVNITKLDPASSLSSSTVLARTQITVPGSIR